MSNKASFILRHFKNKSDEETLAMEGVVRISLDAPTALEDIRVLLGGEECVASFSARYPLSAKRKSHLCKLHVIVAFREAATMPFHSKLTLQLPDGEAAGAIDNEGSKQQVVIRYQAGLFKYLALHGPYYHDKESGLTAYFRQFYDKGTAFTVRHTNTTDFFPARTKVLAARILANVAVWVNPLLLYEKNCLHYEESASVVFERLVDSGVQNARYVLQGDCIDALDVDERYKRYMVRAHSFRHYLYFFRSKCFISTESQYHALELRCQSIWYRRKLECRPDKLTHVLLQHGVMYMVSLDSPERTVWQKRDRGPTIYPVVSSELEARHFVELAGFDRKNLLLCGLPKFDRSYLNPSADKILIMPTWRIWEFQAMRANPESTKYVQMIKRIVEAIPDELKSKVVVVPHPLFDASVYTGTPNAGIPKSYDVLLRDAKLLITDYSSIAYDAFYRGSNVVFYWEEKDECMAHYGEPTHLMIDEDTAFGPVCYSAEELTSCVERIYPLEQDEMFENRYKRIVEFHDGRNTDRLMNSLKSLGIV